MLRGLLRWGREGTGKGAWVLCRVGLSLRGMGSEPPTLHSPYPSQIFSVRLPLYEKPDDHPLPDPCRAYGK